MRFERLRMSAFLNAVTDFVFVADVPEKADVILVPGSRDPEPAELAAKLYLDGLAPRVLPSGRYTKEVGHFGGVRPDAAARYPGPYDTEWAYQRDILLRAGVPDGAILREDRATYTWENAQRSRRVCDEAGLEVRTALLACKPFHARRALLYYQAAFPETRLLVCPCAYPGLQRNDWTDTPEGRKTVLGEVRRLGDQVNEVLEDALAALPEENDE